MFDIFSSHPQLKKKFISKIFHLNHILFAKITLKLGYNGVQGTGEQIITNKSN